MARRSWDHGGKSRQARGYGREHARLRKILLRQEPLCRHCKAEGRVTVATIADHEVSLAKGGAAYTIDNLQPLCRECHDRKTVTEQGKHYRERRQIGLDGWFVDE